MISEPTVLVLGAGASRAYGLPSARELKSLICVDTASSFGQENFNIHTHFKVGIWSRRSSIFRKSFERSHHVSIDRYLELHPEFLIVGKLAIAEALLRFEREEWLFENWEHDRCREFLSRAGKRKKREREGRSCRDFNLYEHVCGAIMASGENPKRALKECKLSVITFNYDRSLEHYLFHTVKNSLPMGKELAAASDDEVREVLEHIKIVHIYGQLGKLPGFSGNLSPVPYGAKGPMMQQMASECIQIVGEGRDTAESLIMAKDLISSASKVIFLGFGFDLMNLQRILPPEDYLGKRVYCGTAMGLNPQTINALKKRGLHWAIHGCIRGSIEDFFTMHDHAVLA